VGGVQCKRECGALEEECAVLLWNPCSGCHPARPHPPPVAAALVEGLSTAPFDATIVADTMGLFGAFTRAQRPHLAWKFETPPYKNPAELTDRRHTFPIITGDGFRSLADYVADREGEVSTLGTQLARDDTPLSARLTQEQALIVFLGHDDATLRNFIAWDIAAKSIRPLVLVCLNGDNDGISLDNPFLENPRVVALFTQNCLGASAKVRCMPIGLENRQWSMHGWTPETIMGSMLGALRGPSPLDRLLSITANASLGGGGVDEGRSSPLAFACFGTHTWPSERQPLVDMIDRDRVKFGWVGRDCNNGLVRYHRNMLDAAVSICPRGHGLDTLRAWETLYLGRVVVTRSCLMDPVWEGLPVIKLGSWEELSLERITEELVSMAKPENLAKTRAATPKIFIPYWACEIGKAANRAAEFCSEKALLTAYTRGDGE
jgi:hypothetical protein